MTKQLDTDLIVGSIYQDSAAGRYTPAPISPAREQLIVKLTAAREAAWDSDQERAVTALLEVLDWSARSPRPSASKANRGPTAPRSRQSSLLTAAWQPSPARSSRSSSIAPATEAQSARSTFTTAPRSSAP